MPGKLSCSGHTLWSKSRCSQSGASQHVVFTVTEASQHAAKLFGTNQRVMFVISGATWIIVSGASQRGMFTISGGSQRVDIVSGASQRVVSTISEASQCVVFTIFEASQCVAFTISGASQRTVFTVWSKSTWTIVSRLSTRRFDLRSKLSCSVRSLRSDWTRNNNGRQWLWMHRWFPVFYSFFILFFFRINEPRNHAGTDDANRAR